MSSTWYLLKCLRPVTDPELDASQRIAVLQQKLGELRKTYMSVKTELAGIDRRRKKLRRREREASGNIFCVVLILYFKNESLNSSIHGL